MRPSEGGGTTRKGVCLAVKTPLFMPLLLVFRPQLQLDSVQRSLLGAKITSFDSWERIWSKIFEVKNFQPKFALNSSSQALKI